MRVENYSSKYFDDVLSLIEEFYYSYLTDYYGHLERATIIANMKRFEGEESKNSFLLISGDKCVGVLAGIEILSQVANEKFFQEIMFYIKPGFGHLAKNFVKNTEIMLKLSGFSSIIMAVASKRNDTKIKRLYERLGYKYLESHYMRTL